MPDSKTFPGLLLFVIIASSGLAQRGDHKDAPGEVQRQPSFPIPPSPVYTPTEALQMFKLAPGFRIELVASEPLVEDPVAIAFDPDGRRIWVVEMRGWMNDVDGAGADQPIGRIVTLDDTDGDGRMDRSTVFMDGLIMPRAVQVARDGVLIAAPPHLWFCRDTDGDGKADEKTQVTDDYMNFASPQTNPEDDPNGLLWNMDNWIYSARYSARFRHREGRWERQPAAMGGQWGLTQDDFGRHFFNRNQDQLRANPLASHYASRNPNLVRPAGWNMQAASDQRVWPVRVSPAANRAYRPEVLRADGTLRIFEAACGPGVYRGGLFPAEFSGNVFVCDPVGHLVKRNIVTERQGILTAEHAYAGHEFLASTDERFRPVNAYTGPDGALYIVDMYRGIIEYAHVMTTYLRNQIIARGLDRPLGHGRLYRIVPADGRRTAAPDMSGLGASQLVPFLSDGNGWRRETAQRLLIERADSSIASELKLLARSGLETVVRMHALWTLEGLDCLDDATLSVALSDPSGKIRSTAVRLAEPWLRASLESPVSKAVLSKADDPAAEVLLQLALSLGDVTAPAGEAALLRVALQRGGHQAAPVHPYMASAVVSGLRGRELEFLDQILAHPELKVRPPGAEELIAVLASAIFREGKWDRIEQVLTRISDSANVPSDASWVRLAVLRGIEGAARKPLSARSEAIAAWDRISDPDVLTAAKRVAGLITWPGKGGAQTAALLNTAQRQRLAAGRREYALCATCHMPNGQGMMGLAPSLVNSRWVLGAPDILVRIILHGKKEYNEFAQMPAFSHLDDEMIAAILTYIRREWGHAASPVDPEIVTLTRRATKEHEGPWMSEELAHLALRETVTDSKAQRR